MTDLAMDLFTPYSDILKGKGNPYHDARGRFTSGPSGKTISVANAAGKLALAATHRESFDALLKTYKSNYKLAELKTIARRFTGYEVVGRTKADIIKAIHNWQREMELNDALHRSQEKAWF